MSTASVPYADFTPSTAIESDEIEADFQALVDFLNNDVIHADASHAFTGVPSGPATDPTSSNQLTRKAYVDATATAGDTAVKALVPWLKGGVSSSRTSDGAGNVTIPHGFPGGTPPVAAVVTCKVGTGPIGASKITVVNVLSIDATNINCRVYNSNTGDPTAGSGWIFHWMAFRAVGV